MENPQPFVGIDVSSQRLDVDTVPVRQPFSELNTEDGIASLNEIDLVLQICDNVEGKCLCPLGDACAMPVRSMVKRFREEFEAHVELGSCPLHDTSVLSTLYPQPRSLLPLLTVSPA